MFRKVAFIIKPKQRSKVKAASRAVLSTDQLHCDTGGGEAHFGGGTKLTVIGKKSKYIGKKAL